ncbi:MAG: hypothetical protein JWN25_762 [Verrucomicrobiales bacterium]|nr:hypothetical protein [Verrucomicrobiales bacterium]
MRKLRAWFIRLAGLFYPQERDSDHSRELLAHLEMHIEDNIQAGMTPLEARRVALLKLGGLEAAGRSCRERSGFPFVENLIQDIRFSSRTLLKSRVFTATAVLTLAVGTGATITVFSIVNALLFRPLPFRQPDRLVWITNPVIGAEGMPNMSRQSNLRSWREPNNSFEDFAGYLSYFERMNYTLTGQGDPARLRGVAVTYNFLKVLGVNLQQGRDFTAEESLRNGPRAIILTDRCWHRYFNGNPTLCGQPVTINGESWTVAGILPSTFDFSSVFTPGSVPADFIRPHPEIPGDRWGNFWAVIARLKPGVPIEKAQAEIDVINRQLQIAHPVRGNFGAILIPFHTYVSGSFRRPFFLISCAVGSVLLIACVNLSNLLLARSSVRRKEMAVRNALGAGRVRLFCQLLTESVLLSGFGAALGLFLAAASIRFLVHSSAFPLPLLSSVHIDFESLVFTLLVGTSTGILFGMAPALHLTRRDLQTDLNDSSRGSSEGAGRACLRDSLIVLEVALACVLLVGATLFTRSFLQLVSIDLGFRTDKVAVWHITPNRDFANFEQETAFYHDLIERVEATPGVAAVGSTSTLAMGLNDVVLIKAKGRAYNTGELPTASLREVSRGYFNTLTIPLHSGRFFDSRDRNYSLQPTNNVEESVVINQKLAMTLWNGEDAIGQTLLIEDRTPSLRCIVIGVIGNIRQNPLQDGASEVYLLGGGRDLVVRSSASLESIFPRVEATLKQLEPRMPTGQYQTLDSIVDKTIAPRRFVSLSLNIFSVVALLLAGLGIYGLIAYSVGCRTHEIGIRLALGSTRRAVLWLITRNGLKLALMGCGIGLLASLALSRFTRSLLTGVSYLDAMAFTLSPIILAAVVMVASWIPARRATRLNLMNALRNE